MHFASKTRADTKIDYILNGYALLSMLLLVRRQLIAYSSPANRRRVANHLLDGTY